MAYMRSKLGVLSLACVLAFSGCSRHKSPTAEAPPADTHAVQTLPAGSAAQNLPEPEAAEPEAPEPTAPAIDMAPASAYLDGVIAALKKAGYTGHQSQDPAAQAAIKEAAQAAVNEDDADAPDPAATARSEFTGLGKTLHNLFINTPAVYRGYMDNIDDSTQKYWLKQVTVLGDIRATVPAGTDEDGNKTPALHYGNLLNVVISSDDDAKSIDDVTITIYESWGNTDGKTITDGGLDALSEDDYAKIAGPGENAPEAVTRQFTWHERSQALGAIADWVRDNTSGSAATAKPAAAKIATSWQP